MSINKSLVQQHFDMHAQEYDRYAKVQAHMARSLIQHVHSLFGAKHSTDQVLHIFEIGCGTGYLTQWLLEQFPHAQLTVLDISATMLATLQSKLAHYAHRIHIVHADAETYVLDPSLSYDLVISSATFQWFSDLRSTIARYLAHIRPQGCFAFSTFTSRTFQELHDSFATAQQQLQLPSYRYGQHYLTEMEWREMFARDEGTSFTWMQEMCLEYYPTVRQFLYAIQRIGAANANLKETSNQANNQLSKRLLKQMESHYEARYASDEGIRVSYDIGYGLYRKS